MFRYLRNPRVRLIVFTGWVFLSTLTLFATSLYLLTEGEGIQWVAGLILTFFVFIPYIVFIDIRLDPKVGE